MYGKQRDGSWMVGLGAALLVLALALLGAFPAKADNPTPNTVMPQSPYEATIAAQFRGGSLGGYGKARAFAVTQTPATAYTNTVSADGVRVLHFANLGAGTVLASLNGTRVSTSNCQVYLPSGMAFTSITKMKVCTVSYYCPAAATAVILIAE